MAETLHDQMAGLLGVVRYDSGVIRGTTADKINYSLVADGPMLTRLAVHMTRHATAHGGSRNWMNGRTVEDRERFRESAFRHFMQWYYGMDDEDHAAAALFNINGAEYVNERLREGGDQ